MTKELELIQDTIFNTLELQITDLNKDSECEEYSGYNFKLNQFNIKFRKAKITPNKIGQFVTLWKRNPETKETEPFASTDNFHFYIVAAENQNNQGFFFFSKNTLVQHHILTTSSKDGKRGFRVYPDWDIPENKQAEKTKNWQEKSFINFSKDNYIEKIQVILDSKI